MFRDCKGSGVRTVKRGVGGHEIGRVGRGQVMGDVLATDMALNVILSAMGNHYEVLT